MSFSHSGNNLKPYLKRICKTPLTTLKLSTSIKRCRIQAPKRIKENEPSDNNNLLLTDLPNEILNKVFSDVSFNDLFNLELVNKRIRNIVRDNIWPKKHIINHETIIQNSNYPLIMLPDLEKEYTCKSINSEYTPLKRHNITNKWIKLFLTRTNIQHLDLSFYFSTITRKVCLFLTWAPQLLSLNLSFIELRKTNLSTIAKFCPLLEEVSFNHLNLYGNNEFNGNCFKHISKKLRYLKISYCYNLTSRAMKFLAKGATKLETLILDCFFRGENINSLLPKLKKLKFFQMRQFRSHFPYSYLNFSNMYELKILCVRGNSLLKVLSLQTLQDCYKLKALDLSYNNQLNSSALMEIKEYPSLKYCNFSGIKKLDWLVDLVQTCKLESLTHLEAMDDNYDTILRSALSSTDFPHRFTILKLAVLKQKQTLPNSKWCEIIAHNDIDEMAFTNFFDSVNH